MPVDPVYCGELWCYIHLNSSHIEKSWFEGWHGELYAGVTPSWPDEVEEAAHIENDARELDEIAFGMGRNTIMLTVINGQMTPVISDDCDICREWHLLNVFGICYRCNMSETK